MQRTIKTTIQVSGAIVATIACQGVLAQSSVDDFPVATCQTGSHGIEFDTCDVDIFAQCGLTRPSIENIIDLSAAVVPEQLFETPVSASGMGAEFPMSNLVQPHGFAESLQDFMPQSELEGVVGQGIPLSHEMILEMVDAQPVMEMQVGHLPGSSEGLYNEIKAQDAESLQQSNDFTILEPIGVLGDRPMLAISAGDSNQPQIMMIEQKREVTFSVICNG